MLYYFAHLRGPLHVEEFCIPVVRHVEMHGFGIISPAFLFLCSTPWNLTVVDKKFWFLSF